MCNRKRYYIKYMIIKPNASIKHTDGALKNSDLCVLSKPPTFCSKSMKRIATKLRGSWVMKL